MERIQITFPFISDIVIKQHVTSQTADFNDLFGFADESEMYYGASIFLVSKHTHTYENVISNLSYAESRIAPEKTKIIPKLELIPAFLLSKPYSKVTIIVRKFINFEVRQTSHSDSLIALSWLRRDPFNWKAVFANKTSNIQELINANECFHVNSEQNPGDLLSRACLQSEMKSNMLLWNGTLTFMHQFIQVKNNDVTPEDNNFNDICFNK